MKSLFIWVRKASNWVPYSNHDGFGFNGISPLCLWQKDLIDRSRDHYNYLVEHEICFLAKTPISENLCALSTIHHNEGSVIRYEHEEAELELTGKRFSNSLKIT